QDWRSAMTDLVRTGAGTVAYADQTCSAQAWFARGERVGYDPEARAIVTSGNAPLKIFLSREGDIAQAVSFLPGFPDGSFGWAKVRPHLPNASEMSKLFFDYVGMGDSDKPKDYAYSTAERADLVEAIWRSLGVQSTMLVAFGFSSLIVLEILRRRLERAERGKTPDGPEIRGVFISMADSLRTGIPTRGIPRRCCAVSRTGLARAWAVPSRCSSGCQESGSCGPRTITSRRPNSASFTTQWTAMMGCSISPPPRAS